MYVEERAEQGCLQEQHTKTSKTSSQQASCKQKTPQTNHFGRMPAKNRDDRNQKAKNRCKRETKSTTQPFLSQQSGRRATQRQKIHQRELLFFVRGSCCEAECTTLVQEKRILCREQSRKPLFDCTIKSEEVGIIGGKNLARGRARK